MSKLEDYRRVMTEIIQQQVVILGPNVALSIARGVPGIFVDENGVVEDLDGEPSTLLQQLISAYVALSGLIVTKATEPLLRKYPSLAGDLVKNTP